MNREPANVFLLAAFVLLTIFCCAGAQGNDSVLTPVRTATQKTVLEYDSAKAREYVRKWCKSGNDCNDGQFKEPVGTDCTHFISHALAAGGIKVANVEALCTSGLCIRVKQLAPAFFNAAKVYANVKQVSKSEAQAGDFVFRVSFFGRKSHVMMLASKPDAAGAEIYGHDNNRCGQYVQFDLDDCKYYRIEDAVDIDIGKLENQLTRHEGKRSGVYKDIKGIPTIGIGLNLRRPDARAKVEGVGADFDSILAGTSELTNAQISRLFKEDVATSILAGRSIVKNFDELGDVRKRVIVDMAFNLGVTGLLKFKKMRAAVEAKDFTKAGAEMVDSAWYRQVRSRGKTLVDMMTGGRDPKWLK